MIKSNFLNIFNKFCKETHQHYSERKFSRDSGISFSITKSLFNNKVNGLKFDTLDKLVKFFDVPPSSFVIYYNRTLRLVLYDATPFWIKSAIKRCNLDVDMPRSDESKGIAITFLGAKSPVHVILVPTFPLYPSESGSDDFHFNFGYQVISNSGWVDDYGSFNLSYNKRFQYIWNNNLTSRLQRYIYSRMLLHSGFIKHNGQHKISVSGIPTVSEPTDEAKFYLNFGDAVFKNADELIHIWKRQPNEYDTDHDKYKLISSKVGQPIKIYDYTTNEFSK